MAAIQDTPDVHCPFCNSTKTQIVAWFDQYEDGVYHECRRCRKTWNTEPTVQEEN